MFEYKVVSFEGAGNIQRTLNIEAEDGGRLVQAFVLKSTAYFVFEKVSSLNAPEKVPSP